MSRSDTVKHMPDKESAMAAGWVYYHSYAIGMDYAVRSTPLGPEVMTADKVRYSPGEVAVLNAGGVEVSKELHNVKKVFSGIVIDVRRTM